MAEEALERPAVSSGPLEKQTALALSKNPSGPASGPGISTVWGERKGRSGSRLRSARAGGPTARAGEPGNPSTGQETCPVDRSPPGPGGSPPP